MKIIQYYSILLNLLFKQILIQCYSFVSLVVALVVLGHGEAQSVLQERGEADLQAGRVRPHADHHGDPGVGGGLGGKGRHRGALGTLAPLD